MSKLRFKITRAPPSSRASIWTRFAEASAWRPRTQDSTSPSTSASRNSMVNAPASMRASSNRSSTRRLSVPTCSCIAGR